MLATAYNRRCFDQARLNQDLLKALADCNKALSLVRKQAQSPVLDSRGLVRLRMGEYDKAIADFDVSLQSRPNNAWSLFGRGIAKLRKNQVGDGSVDIAAAEKIAPKISEAFSRYGIAP